MHSDKVRRILAEVVCFFAFEIKKAEKKFQKDLDDTVFFIKLSTFMKSLISKTLTNQLFSNCFLVYYTGICGLHNLLLIFEEPDSNP
jgi:hypothetical protein